MKVRIAITAIMALVTSAASNAQTFTFQQDVSSYSGTESVMVSPDQPDNSWVASDSSDEGLSADQTNSDFSDDETQVLLRFDNIIGGANIPENSVISSATLRLRSTSATDDTVTLSVLSEPFTTSSTWNTLTGGPSTSGTVGSRSNIPSDSYTTFNVTNSVQAIVNGTTNDGWLFTVDGPDGWDFCSELADCDNTTAPAEYKPLLTVTLRSGATPVPALGVFGLVMLILTLPLLVLRHRR